MREGERVQGWRFVDESGAFVLAEPHKTSYLYFPLVNEVGMMSAVTPLLHGDSKTGQNTFLMTPVSVEDLHNTRSARNFWVYVEGVGPWSATGNSAPQVAQTFVADEVESVVLEAGFLWHKVTRENARVGLRAEITNVVPSSGDHVELMKVTLTNVGGATLTLSPTAAIPLYGRSADNLHDHRHVTSLLHRIRTHTHGVLVRPTLSFDERGHKPNTVTYGVLGAEGDGAPPVGFFPVVEDFIGEGGNLEWPEAVVKPPGSGVPAGTAVDGYEAVGALRFQDVVLEPGEAKTYVLIMAVMEEGAPVAALLKAYGSAAQFDRWLERTQAHWQAKLEMLAFNTADSQFNAWMKWVEVQPILRRLLGNSFLPYHDYGRGGRGWRDLWQDCLALLLMAPDEVRDLLFSNFGGVRIDGSNATIIGARPGAFIADRNNIPRVWMDHGAWPLLTARLYIDQSGDLAFLLQGQTYFKDPQIFRCEAQDEQWSPEQGTQLRMQTGEVYQGTILEHILVQHLTSFFHVGDHNTMQLEGADWNDGMDMAPERGESVAFTALYAGNLRDLGALVLALEALGVTEVELAAELLPLLDTLGARVDYDDVAAKRRRLMDYFASCRHAVSGEKVKVGLQALAQDLTAKADWLYGHIRRQEWIENREGFGWFNGYYDNDGERVEGDRPGGVRMTLVGQVFTLMGGIATDAQAREIVRAADRYLFDAQMGGYRLNTDFGDIQLNLGRCFGFAFGHKENGAMFSHMAVMYANALYRRGMVREGHKVLDDIYRHCRDFTVSRIYPGIPEYISARGRGLYPYLTGSASWYLLTLLNEVFGVKGVLGDLAFEPKLVQEQFGEDGAAGVLTLFADRDLEIVYHNPRRLDYGAYAVRRIAVDGDEIPFKHQGNAALVVRQVITALPKQAPHRIDIELS